ncbi:hypothetical protein [Taklimakanibacter albus]|uniref:Uncharacterized protein n=1 Tax=Taklimakanibacter albus TaxID=2800327 RepID=A0ACC5R707_9HYPH|nr:hypothetical protein [Aestuariivirga sp. YIM B02566]MBK1868281.1 hypothetical protein [Aestuariivirga sp. YIM B02566]
MANADQDCSPTLVGSTYIHADDCQRAKELGLPRWSDMNPRPETLPALFPDHRFGSRHTREMTFTVGAGSHARNLMVIDQSMSAIRAELVAIASDVIEEGGETTVTFSITFDHRGRQ